MTQNVILRGQSQRDLAKRMIDAAPVDYVVTVGEPKRSIEANALMWCLLSDISRAKPEGRVHSPETWKCLFMAAHGYEVRFEMGLDNRPFPVGFSTSKLSKRAMADLITFIQAWGDERAVPWSDMPMKGYGDVATD